MNVHLKGQGKMQVSNGGVDEKKKIYISGKRSVMPASIRPALKIPRTRLVQISKRRNLLGTDDVRGENFDETSIASSSDEVFRGKYRSPNVSAVYHRPRSTVQTR